MKNVSHRSTTTLDPIIPRRRRGARAVAPIIAILALAGCLLWPLPGGHHALADDHAEHDAWPYPGFDDAQIRDYIDERAGVLAINSVLGRAILWVNGVKGSLAFPLSWIDSKHRDIVPILPVRSSRQEALSDLRGYEPWRKRGYTPVLFYRDAHGLIWPTHINPDTMPRMMQVYPKAMAAAGADNRATRDTFIDVAFWYLGARVPGATRSGSDAAGAGATSRASRAPSSARAGARASAPAAGRVIIAKGRSVSAAEREIMHKLAAEGRTVEALAESTVSGRRTADFLVDGVKTELETVSNITSKNPTRALKNIIEDAAGQASHIIVDVRQQAGMTADLAKEAAGGRFGETCSARSGGSSRSG